MSHQCADKCQPDPEVMGITVGTARDFWQRRKRPTTGCGAAALPEALGGVSVSEEKGRGQGPRKFDAWPIASMLLGCFDAAGCFVWNFFLVCRKGRRGAP